MSGVIDHYAWWSDMLAHLWQSGIVILLLWALSTSLRRAPARYHSAIWWLALAKLLLPLAMVAALLGWLRPASMGGPLEQLGQTLAGLPGFRLQHSAPQPNPAEFGFAALTVLWLAGAVAFPVVGRLRRARRAASASAMPRIVGVLRPRVVVPRCVRDFLRPEELEAVILHEEAHRRRRDPQKSLAIGLVGSLFWFFPLAWLVVRRLRDATEMACDEEVLAAGVCPGAYARALARTVQMGLVSANGSAHFARSGRTVGPRLERIGDPGRFTAVRVHGWVRAGAVCLLALSLAPAFAAPPVQEGGSDALMQEIGPAHALLVGLDGVDRQVTLTVRDEPLRRLLRRLGRLGGFEVAIEGPGGERRVNVELRNRPIGEALAGLARDHGLEYGVSADGTALTVSVLPRVGKEIQSPERLGYVVPEYPVQARRMRIQGVVILEVTIDKQGIVTAARPLRGIHPLLDDAAVESVLQWRYAPTLFDGRPVAVKLTVTVAFKLEEESR